MTKKQNKFYLTIIAIVLAIVSMATVFLSINLSKQVTTKEIGWTAYSVGSISSTTGKYEEATDSVYTKDYYTVDGLEVEVDEEATITYSLCFYKGDDTKTFISKTSDLTGGSTITVPEEAEFFRVVIKSTEIERVDVLDVIDIASQLSITINK